jgi:pilus assembly protein Flp/PilA
MLRAWIGLQNTFTDDEGATLVEYALLLVLIAIVAIIALNALGGTVSDTFQDVNDCLEDTANCPSTTAGG